MHDAMQPKWTMSGRVKYIPKIVMDLVLGFEHSNTPMVYMQPYKPWIYVFSIIHANKNFPRL